MKYIAPIAAAVASLLVACRAHNTHSKRTVEQFSFLEVGMPMTVVSNRVGPPDRGYRGQIRWRYDLADGSEMVITADSGEPDYSFATWRVIWFGQQRGDKWLWLKPAEAK